MSKATEEKATKEKKRVRRDKWIIIVVMTVLIVLPIGALIYQTLSD